MTGADQDGLCVDSLDRRIRAVERVLTRYRSRFYIRARAPRHLREYCWERHQRMTLYYLSLLTQWRKYWASNA